MDECTLWTFFLLPYFQVYGGGKDIFIVYAEVCPTAVVFVDGVVGALVAGWNKDFEYGASFDAVGGHLACYGRLAIEFGCGFNHVNFFFGADACYFSVVFDADKEPPAFGIGKCRERFGYFAGVGDFEFEVLPDVFALFD